MIGADFRKFVRVDGRKKFKIADVLNPDIWKRCAVMGHKVIEPVGIRIREPRVARREDHGRICESVGKSAKEPAGSGSDPADAGQSIRSVRSLRNLASENGLGGSIVRA